MVNHITPVPRFMLCVGAIVVVLTIWFALAGEPDPRTRGDHGSRTESVR